MPEPTTSMAPSSTLSSQTTPQQLTCFLFPEDLIGTVYFFREPAEV